MEENTQKNEGGHLKKWGSGLNWRLGSVMPWLEKQAGRPLKKSDKIIGIILIVIFLFVFYVVLDANKYKALVRVIPGEGTVGVNPTTENLDFGDLTPGTTQVRRVEIKNGIFMPVYVMIWKTGGIAELMDIKENFFKVYPGEEKKVEFSVYVPNLEISNASGTPFNGRVYLFKVPTFGL